MMHLLIVRLSTGEAQYFGPFQTFFRANEYGKVLEQTLKNYVGHQVVKLELPVTMKVRFRGGQL